MSDLPPPPPFEQTSPKVELTTPLIAFVWDVETDSPTEPLKEILRLTTIPETLSLENLVTRTQSEWIRSYERSKICDTEKLAAIQPALLLQVDKLQMVKTIEPKNVNYSSILVTGSKLAVFEKRLDEALKRIACGAITLDALWILSGERVLEQDEIDALKKMGCNALDERDMMEFITRKRVGQIEASFPIEFVKAPKIAGSLRATTIDTIKVWLERDQNISTAPTLLVTSQPYGLYQFLVLRGATPKDKKLDLLAVETGERRSAIFLDTLARILFLIKNSSRC